MPPAAADALVGPAAILAPDIQDLLELIYRVPIGIIRFRADGAIDMMNPAASALLSGLIGEAGFDNIFATLRLLCPELAAKLAAFDPPAGIILDQRRIDGRAGGKSISLCLTVTRVRGDVHMAVLKDVTKLTDMLAYAFAAADLLLDVDADGRIGWAGGAFRTLLDMRPQDAIGTAIETLISPRDRESLAQALMVIGVRGRLPPILLRLANQAETRCVMSGLRVEGAGPRYLITVGPPPATQVAAGPTLRSGRKFAIELENWVRGGNGGTLGLIDIEGWDSTTARLDDTRAGCLKHSLDRLAAEAGPDMVVGQIGDGRFGMLAGNQADLASCADALEELIGSFAGGEKLRLERTNVALDQGGLSPTRTMQALRLLLHRFGAGGTQAATATGLASGLAGIIAHATGQKRSIASLIAAGRFAVVYQPIVSLVDRALHHYEALLRPAAEPGVGTGTPQEFVTLVETVGLSQELDIAVLRRVTTQLRHCTADIAANISGHSIGDPGFTERVLALAATAPRGRLLLELTETAEIADLAAAAAQIERIRAAHVRVCLDDFGAGSASFRYLRDLRVDFVKIDGTYVRAAPHSQQSRAFVRAMRDLATASGADAIAEMIETEADATLMRELGVNYGQGWLFGKPGQIAPDQVDIVRWRY